MTQNRQRYADDTIRPDRDNTDLPNYHLIRVYSREPSVALLKEPDENTLLMDLKHNAGAVFWCCKGVNTKTKLDSYFVVIDREVDKKIQWNSSKYLRVNQLWDPPSDWRKERSGSSKIAAASFITTAAKEVISQSNTIAKFFSYGVSMFMENSSHKSAVADFRKALDAMMADQEDVAEAKAKAEKCKKKTA